VVAFTTVKFATGAPPIVALVAPVKLVPAIVTFIPPRFEPVAGATLVNVGTAPYVNPPASVPFPVGVATTTFCAPLLPAGVVPVIVVAFTIVIPTSGLPLIVAVVPATKFAPEIETDVPPAVDPEPGAIDAIVGAPPPPPPAPPPLVYVNPPASVAEPFGPA